MTWAIAEHHSMGTSTEPCPFKLSYRAWDEFGAERESGRVCKWKKIEPTMTLETQLGSKCLENEIFKNNCGALLSEWLVVTVGKCAWFQAWTNPEDLGLLQQGPILPWWASGWRRTSPPLGETDPMCTQKYNRHWLIQQKPAKTLRVSKPWSNTSCAAAKVDLKPSGALNQFSLALLQLWKH